MFEAGMLPSTLSSVRLLPSALAGTVHLSAGGEWVVSAANNELPLDAPAPLADRFARFRSALQQGDYEYLRADLNVSSLLDLTERSVAGPKNVMLPFSFFATVVRGAGPRDRGQWRHVLVITEPESVGPPVVAALVREFGATVQSETPARDFATLLTAHELVPSSSTFSYMAGLLGRAHTVHYAHALQNSYRPGMGPCLVPPLYAASRTRALHESRFVFHDVLAASVDFLLLTAPDAVARMQRVHGWDGAALERCRSRHKRSHYFLKQRVLEAMYRDPECSRIYMPSALGAGGVPRLCVDDFQDWDALCTRWPRSRL